MSIYSMKRNFIKRWKILSQLWIPFSGKGVAGHSAATCYYIILSILPTTALILTIFSLLPITQEQNVLLLWGILPEHFYPIAEYFFINAVPKHPTALVSVWALLTLWSAAKGILSLSDGVSVLLNIANENTFFRRRFRAMLSFILLALILFLTLTVHVFGQRIISELSGRLPLLSDLFRLLYALRHLYSVLILSLLIGFLFRLLSSHNLAFRLCLLSGILSSVGWMLTSYGFSIYVNLSRPKFHSGMGLLILFCLWLHFCISILLYSILFVTLFHSKAYEPVKIIKRAFSKL